MPETITPTPLLRLQLRRNCKAQAETSQFTPGELYVDDKFFCYTLEDPVREQKIWGETAIPEGLYKVVITHSPKFGRRMPLLLGVPGFDGIRIHEGNTVKDTHGCPLVGMDINLDTGFLKNSRKAYDKLFAVLEKASAAGAFISIDITTAKHEELGV